MSSIPVRLEKDTVVEALCEVRFSPKDSGVSALLPGYFRQRMSDLVPNVERLPTADLPAHLMRQDDNLKYQPSYRLTGPRYRLAIGEHVVSLAAPAPYPGWDEFRSSITRFLVDLLNFDLVQNFERLSLRYTNIVPEFEGLDLVDALQCSFQLGSFDLRDYGFHLRTEIEHGGCNNIVQVAPKSMAKNRRTGESMEGGYLDIDSIYAIDEDILEPKFEQIVEQVHDAEKEVFFSILSAEAQRLLGAEYE